MTPELASRIYSNYLNSVNTHQKHSAQGALGAAQRVIQGSTANLVPGKSTTWGAMSKLPGQAAAYVQEAAGAVGREARKNVGGLMNRVGLDDYVTDGMASPTATAATYGTAAGVPLALGLYLTRRRKRRRGV
jgi:hypothetical protein